VVEETCGSEHSAQRQTTVLLIDDDDAVRWTTAEILRDANHLVVEAADGTDGLERLQDSPIDVVVLDLSMPGTDGYGFLAAVDLPPPVIVVSAFIDDEMDPRFGSKVFGFIRKPAPPTRLLAMVATAVENGPAGRSF